MSIKLIKPTQEWFDKINEYKNLFILHNEKKINGSGGLHHYDSLNEWLESVQLNEIREPDEEYVPGTVYLVILDHQVIGTIQIRHMLNQSLLEYGGHIGYAIAPDKRNKGYGTEMLREALNICRNMGLDKVLITCDQDNYASSKIIINNKGQLENEIFTHNVFIQRYWITL